MVDESSTHIGGNVNVTGGDFVAGNKTIINQPGSTPEALTPEQLAAAETRYRAQVGEHYNRLGFAGLGVGDLRLSDVPLDDVFVRLTLTVEKIVRESISPEEWAQEREREKPSRNPFRRGEKKEDERPRERTITVQEPITLGDALAQHALIVGEPGAGKSTLLRWLAVTFAAGRQRETDRLGPQADADRLPLLLELGRLPEAYLQANSRETPNWKSFLPQHLTKQPPFDDIPAAFLEQALAAGRCLLLCDGLDEIADLSARRRIADSLADYARSSTNRLVLSSRPAGVSGSEASLGARFQRLTIQRFAPEDVRRFFGFIYAQDSELTPDEAREETDRLYTVVESQPKTLELATTPLLATLLLLLWNQDGYLPERRVELYARCCQMLIESWEAQHDVAYTGVLAEIGWERHLRLLAPLAYAIHNTGQRTDAPANELIPVLAQAMQAEGLAPPASATLEAEKFLRTLSLRSGLLQFLGTDENGQGRYGFPHLTFQEYLTARHIAAQPDPDYIDLVMVHLHKAWWREVHLLVIGHLGSGSEPVGKASKLLLCILYLYPLPWRVMRPTRFFFWNPKWFLNLIYISLSSRRNLILWWLVIAVTFVVSAIIGLFASISNLFCNLMAAHVNWQLEPRLAWVLNREFIFVASGLFDSNSLDTKITIHRKLKDLAQVIVVQTVLDPGLHEKGENVLMSAVAETLAYLGEVSPGVVMSLHVALFNKNRRLFGASVQEAATRSLVQLSKASPELMATFVMLLVKELGDSKLQVRRKVASSLGQLGRSSIEVVTALVQTLRDSSWQVRRTAATSLKQLGYSSPAVVSKLMPMLEDSNLWVQVAAVGCLGQLGQPSTEVVSALLNVLADSEWQVREAAASSLGELGRSSSEVVSALVSVLTDSEWQVREAAASSLGELGQPSSEVVSALMGVLNDSEWRVWEAAAGSLAQLGQSLPAVVLGLMGALRDPDFNVRAAAVESLVQLAPLSPDVASGLMGALRDCESSWVRQEAAWSLGQLGQSSPEVVSALVRALRDSKSRVRQEAAVSLVQLGHKSQEIMSVLVRALGDSELWVWQTAAASLEQMKIEDEVQLRRVLIALNRRLHDRDDDVRRAALTAIRRLLDGRQIPGYRWVPIREQQRRARIRKRIGWAVLGLGLVMLALCIGGVVNGQLDLAAGWVRVVGGLAGLAFLAAGVDLWLARRRRPPWDR